MNKSIIFKLVFVLAIIIVAISFYSAKSKLYINPLNKEPMINEETIKQPMAASSIEGSLSFPSEVMPPMKICAEETISKNQYCTTTQIEDKKYTYGKGYKLELPAGDYVVYSQEIGHDKKAYYSEFVTCGLRVECPSHKPIIVNVNDGESISGVDPQDWYVEN